MLQQLRSIFTLVSICVLPSLHAQLVVDESQTPTQLVEEVLLGGGISVSNVTFNGVPAPGTPQIGSGSFTATGTNLGIDTGIILATGEIASAVGPAEDVFSNDPTETGSDPDLEMITGTSVYDRAVLEFDFIPTGDSVKFRYVFASEEYPDFVCSIYNDAFGFFLSGPGINGMYENNAVNIALIPNSTVPVSINSVNSGFPGLGYLETTCMAADPNFWDNTVYFVDNELGEYISYGGFTVVLEAAAEVVCGETYHIKLALGDAADPQYDSAVFLEAGSFASDASQVSVSLAPGVGVSGDTLSEGCPVEVLFQRTGDLSTEITLDLAVTGTATPGMDFTPLFPQQINFAAGESSQSILLDVFMDGDPLETLVLTLSGFEMCDGNTEQEYTFYIAPSPPLEVELGDVSLGCGDDQVLEPIVSGGVGSYEFLWSTGETTPSIAVQPPTDTEYEVTVSDGCQVEPVTVSAMVTIEAEPLSIQVSPETMVPCGEESGIEVTSVEGGTAPYTYAWAVNGQAVGNTQSISVAGGAPAWYVATVTDDCGVAVQDSVLVSALDPPAMEIEVSPETLLPCEEEVVIAVTSVAGGSEDLSYSWIFNGMPVGDEAELTVDQAGWYIVTVEEGCGGAAQDSVLVSPMDPVPVEIEVSPEAVLPCNGSVQIAVLETVGGNGSFTYEWTLNGTDVGSSAAISVEEVGLYVVTVTEGCGGTAQDSVPVVPSETGPLLVTASDDVVVPCEENAQLSVIDVDGGDGAFTYTWMAEGVEIGQGPTINVPGTGPTWYVVTVVDGCGASGLDSVLVSPAGGVDLLVSASEDVVVICSGDTALLEVLDVEGATGEVSYSWMNGAGAVVGTDATLEVDVLADQTYTVTVTDACGNSGEAQVATIINYLPMQLQLPADITICAGEEVQLLALVTGGSGYYFIEWAEQGITDPSITVTPAQTTLYSVTATDQCGQVLTDEVMVEVEHVQVDILVENLGQDDWHLQAVVLPEANSWIWDMGDSTSYRGPQVAHSYMDLEEHLVTVQVTTLNGCSAIDSVLLQPPAHLYFPNSFTPDGDGFNETFGAVGHSITEFELEIFDRWGELIFSANDPQQQWDGMLNGKPVQTGVYVYRYKAKGNYFPFVEGFGHITLLRGDSE